MKGCLSLIIKITIALLVFFGLKYLGIIDIIQEKINEYRGSSQEQNINKAKEVVDLSQIDEEYTIDKTVKVFKNRMILAQHNGTGQKMVILEPMMNNMLTKEDINSGDVEDKLNKLARKYKILKFEKLEVTKKDSFNGIEQNIPYVKIDAKVANLPVSDFEGIIGAATLNNGMNIIVVSVNEKNKYSQIITEAFFRKVKSA